MWFFLACHALPVAEDLCTEVDEVVGADDRSLGFSAEEVWSLLAEDRVLTWDADDEVSFSWTPDVGEVLLQERSDGPDGECPRTGSVLRVPVVLDVLTSELQAELSGTADAWALAEGEIELSLADAGDVDVDADLEVEAADLVEAEDATLLGYRLEVTGEVSGGEMRLDAEVSWSSEDSGEDDEGEGEITLREGDWRAE